MLREPCIRQTGRVGGEGSRQSGLNGKGNGGKRACSGMLNHFETTLAGRKAERVKKVEGPPEVRKTRLSMIAFQDFGGSSGWNLQCEAGVGVGTQLEEIAARNWVTARVGSTLG